jgi:PAS domain S-box-containing protein
MNGQNAEVPESADGYEPPQGLRPRRIARLAWLPIPLLVAAIIAVRAAGLHESYKSETLTLILSLTFYTLVSLGTIFLVGRSFLASGRPALLLLECGVVLWSLAGTVGDFVSHGDANINVTIFNISILLAGLCHLTGAILSLQPQRAIRAPALWLVAGWALTLGALWLVTHAALLNWLPVFFIPGQGGTLVRYWVLISAITMFVLSAVLLLASQRSARVPFTSWYALALLLLAVGLFGVMIQSSLGSVVNWLGRSAQWLGGVYLLLAATATLRESDLTLLPLAKESLPERYRYGVAISIVLAAAALRLAFLPMLGMRVTFLTFYPAVMLAALYGGLRSGLLATALAALLAGYFWMEPIGQLTIRSPADLLSLFIFLLSGSMIAWVCEAMHRARARAKTAETKAVLAAEREAVADVLRKSEERYHTLFNGMTEGFAIHEVLIDESGKPVDYRFLDVNPVFERLTGLKRQDVVGKTHNEVLPGDDPKWLQMYSQVALTGRPIQFENYTPILNRHYKVFAYRPASLQFAVIFMDITDRKRAETALRESESRLAQALRIANVGSWEWDLQSDEVSWCNQMYRMFGEERESFVPTYESFLSHVYVEDRQKLENTVRDALARRGSYEIEYRIITHTSETRVILAHGEVVCDSAGKPTRVIGTALDLTARKHIEEDLRKTQESLELRVQERTTELSQAYEELQREVEARGKIEEQLRQSQKMEAIGTLAGGIAHDFNNILAAIIGFGEMVEEDLPPESPSIPRIQRVLNAASRGTELVRQILTFSRKTELTRTPLSLAPLIKETIQFLRASLPTTIEIKLSMKAARDTILASPAELQQILMNLVTNASFAMKEAGGILGINVTNVDFEPDSPVLDADVEPGEYVQLAVTDTGSGIAPHVMKRIFEPFFTTKEVGEGTGMGLPVVYGVVKSLHGTISVESEPGAGSTFRVFLPIARTDEKLEGSEAQVTPKGTERILFVDDEELLTEWGQAALERLGYAVTALTDSTEALKLFSIDPSRFDLVITDQTMPKLTGLNLARKLLTIRNNIPIILCTGHSDSTSPEKAKEAGVKEFLIKPLGKQQLAEVIRRVLNTTESEG